MVKEIQYSTSAYVPTTNEMLDLIKNGSFNSWLAGENAVCIDYKHLKEDVKSKDDMDKDLKEFLEEVIQKIDYQTRFICDVVFH